MLILLSPAKKLASITKPYLDKTTSPVFKKETKELIQIMKNKTEADIAQLMDLSLELAFLNFQRYQHFDSPNGLPYPAIFLFQGDVYQNLKPQLWDNNTLNYAQSHCAILSGLYGLLRPLDAILPYRLEMGVKLKTALGSNLYIFWGDLITQEINNRIETQKNPIIINLASTEYFNAVKTTLLKAPLLTIHFQERKNNELKTIGIQAKKARGAMANYILQNQIENAESIKDFNLLNYQFCEKSSNDKHFYFIR